MHKSFKENFKIYEFKIFSTPT